MLPDVNIWLALAFEVHAHHSVAANWFAGIESCHWCRLTQQGFLRLATNPSVFGNEAVTLTDAWSCFDVLLEDERVGFRPEPPDLETRWRQHTTRRSYSPKVWNDAFLAAFAQSAKLTLVTFDSGFQGYRGLELALLSA